MARTLDYGRLRRRVRSKRIAWAGCGFLAAAVLLLVLPTLYGNARTVLRERRIIAHFTTDERRPIYAGSQVMLTGNPDVLIGSRLEQPTRSDVIHVVDLANGSHRRRIVLQTELVHEVADADEPGRPDWVRLKAIVFHPSTFCDVDPSHATSVGLMLDVRSHETLSLDMPRPDPADPSRLTLPFVTPSGALLINLHLLDDGTVTLDRAQVR